MFHTQFSSHQWEQQGRGVKNRKRGIFSILLTPYSPLSLVCEEITEKTGVKCSSDRMPSRGACNKCSSITKTFTIFLSLDLINSYDKYILNQEVTISVTIWPRARFSSLAVLEQWKENSPHQFISCLVIS